MLGRLRALRVPAFTTSDAAAAVGASVEAASQALRRLAAAGLVTPVRRGLWTTRESPDPLTLGDYVTAPHPSYVSLQSALHLHGMIEQIPNVTYLVSLGRTARIQSGVGTFSVHHVGPELFGGATLDHRTGVRLASPERFDVSSPRGGPPPRSPASRRAQKSPASPTPRCDHQTSTTAATTSASASALASRRSSVERAEGPRSRSSPLIASCRDRPTPG